MHNLESNEQQTLCEIELSDPKLSIFKMLEWMLKSFNW